MTSRLLAVCYFTVSYKWCIIGAFLFHGLVTATVDTICGYLEQGDDECDCCCGKGILSAFLFPVHWLRDDIVLHFPFTVEKTTVFLFSVYIRKRPSPSFCCSIFIAQSPTRGTRYQSQSACVCSVLLALLWELSSSVSFIQRLEW